MNSIILATYLFIGLLFAHNRIKKTSDRINSSIQEGNTTKNTEKIIQLSEHLSSQTGHKNFVVLLYIVFSITWFPAVIYALVKKNKSN